MFGWKRSGSKPASDSESQLLRFFNQSPSFLDDPQNADLFRERARKILGPRPKDEGRPSYWEAATGLQRTYLAAQNGSRRDKLAKFHILCIDQALVSSHGFRIAEECDSDAYKCLADLHRTIDMRPPETLERFVELLRNQLIETLDSGQANRKAIAVKYDSLTKADVQQVLKDAAYCCPDLDLSGALEWVQQAVAESGSSSSSNKDSA